ncbi:MAG: hypothetical protein RIC04_11625 [Parvibaculum sp.]|uniref:hypothetical protein n=1 Tax=Parvibaculum sp. TaxID=2024848 RepID=UPI0032EFB17B
MLATESFVEKDFEVWPGLLRMEAAGDGAREALDAGMDAAREVSQTLIADAELLAGGSADVLPRGRAGRLAMEAYQTVRDALPADSLPPVLAALPGAVCDTVLAAMCARCETASLFVSLDGVVAIHRESGSAVPPHLGLPPVLREFSAVLGNELQGGVALGGLHVPVPTSGLADLVAVQTRGAALAGFVASALADATDVASVAREPARLRDRLFDMGWKGRRVTGGTGLIEPEEVWQALSAAVRRASALREKRLLRAAALGLKGRGRTVGPVDGDRLLRFGVSEWR